MFQEIIVRLGSKRIAETEKMLRKVPVMQLLCEAERKTLLAALTVKVFQPDMCIIEQARAQLCCASFAMNYCRATEFPISQCIASILMTGLGQ